MVGVAAGLTACEPPGPRVYIYGDSLAWESREAIQAWGAARKYDVVLHSRFGGAPCSFFDQMRSDRSGPVPVHAVIVAFTGNPAYMSPCVGPDQVASHGQQIRELARIWEGSGAHVIWAATPRLPYDVSERAQDAMRAEATRLGLVVADAGQYVTPHRKWATVMPCLTGEPCVGHEINPAVPPGHNIVRANDGVHFCPGGPRGFTPCPYYSSGAWRFARALTGALTLVPRPAAPA